MLNKYILIYTFSWVSITTLHLTLNCAGYRKITHLSEEIVLEMNEALCVHMYKGPFVGYRFPLVLIISRFEKFFYVYICAFCKALTNLHAKM
jgi:hypothetical protein